MSITKKTNPKDEQRLIKNGWWKTDQGLWLRDGMNARLGGLTLSSALERQEELETIAKIGRRYIVVSDRFGFGYRIRYEDASETYHNTDYNHLEKEDAKEICAKLNKGKYVVAWEFLKKNYLKIIVFKEKHGDRHFIVHNRPELENVALYIALERHEAGWWYHFDTTPPTEPKVKLEDADKLGEAVARVVKQEWDSYKTNLKYHKTSVRLKEALDKVVKEKDAKLALLFLDEMKDGEYEGFEIIEPEEIE